MATNAYGMDFYIGRVLRSKDKRDNGRHVIIADLKNGKAKCHRLILGSPGKMNSHSSRISLKTLATRFEHCRVEDCGYCATSAKD